MSNPLKMTKTAKEEFQVGDQVTLLYYSGIARDFKAGSVYTVVSTESMNPEKRDFQDAYVLKNDIGQKLQIPSHLVAGDDVSGLVKYEAGDTFKASVGENTSIYPIFTIDIQAVSRIRPLTSSDGLEIIDYDIEYFIEANLPSGETKPMIIGQKQLTEWIDNYESSEEFLNVIPGAEDEDPESILLAKKIAQREFGVGDIVTLAFKPLQETDGFPVGGRYEVTQIEEHGPGPRAGTYVIKNEEGKLKRVFTELVKDIKLADKVKYEPGDMIKVMQGPDWPVNEIEIKEVIEITPSYDSNGDLDDYMPMYLTTVHERGGHSSEEKMYQNHIDEMAYNYQNSPEVYDVFGMPLEQDYHNDEEENILLARKRSPKDRFLKASRNKFKELCVSHSENIARQILQKWEKNNIKSFYKTAQEDENDYSVGESVWPIVDNDINGEKGDFLGLEYTVEEVIYKPESEYSKHWYKIDNGDKEGLFEERALVDDGPFYEVDDYIDDGDQGKVLGISGYDVNKKSWQYIVEYADEDLGTSTGILEKYMNPGDEGEFDDVRAGEVSVFVAITDEEAYGAENIFDIVVADEDTDSDRYGIDYFGNDMPYNVLRFDNVPRRWAEEMEWDTNGGDYEHVFDIYLNKNSGANIHSIGWDDLHGEPEIQEGNWFIDDGTGQALEASSVYADFEDWKIDGKSFADEDVYDIYQSNATKIPNPKFELYDDVFVIDENSDRYGTWGSIENMVLYDTDENMGFLYEVEFPDSSQVYGENFFESMLTSDTEAAADIQNFSFNMDPAAEELEEGEGPDEDILLASKKESQLVPEIKEGDWFISPNGEMLEVEEVQLDEDSGEWKIWGKDFTGHEVFDIPEHRITKSDKAPDFELDDKVFVMDEDSEFYGKLGFVADLMDYHNHGGGEYMMLVYFYGDDGGHIGEDTISEVVLTDDTDTAKEVLSQTFNIDPAAEELDGSGGEDILLASKREADYTGEEEDYNLMVKNVQATIEAMQQLFRSQGFRSDTWQNLINGSFEKAGLDLGETIPAEEDGDTEYGARWFVDKMLSWYSKSWEHPEDMPIAEQMAESLMGPFREMRGLTPTEEQMQSGEHIPGVDKTIIETAMMGWDQEIQPRLMKAAQELVGETNLFLQQESATLAGLVEIFGEDAVNDIVYPYLSSYLNKWNKPLGLDLKSLSPQEMAIITMAYHMAGSLDPYEADFKLWASSPVPEIEEVLMEE